jgi:hypothetical protein
METTRIVERPNYVVGMVLTADDLRQEQEYTRDRERAHNRLHGWGVVSGLEVEATKPGSGRVVVSPGSALDGHGQEIVLTRSIEVDVSGATSSKRPDCVYVVIAYGEEEVEQVPVLGVEVEDEVVATRIREAPTVSVVEVEDDRGVSLMLARIDLSKTAKTITARRIDDSVRRVVGTAGP